MLQPQRRCFTAFRLQISHGRRTLPAVRSARRPSEAPLLHHLQVPVLATVIIIPNTALPTRCWRVHTALALSRTDGTSDRGRGRDSKWSDYARACFRPGDTASLFAAGRVRHPALHASLSPLFGPLLVTSSRCCSLRCLGPVFFLLVTRCCRRILLRPPLRLVSEMVL